MRYWFDTEFIEDGKTIDLISIGIVAEDGREFYAQNLDCDMDKANDWVRANVWPHLQNWEYWHHRDGDPVGWFTRESIAAGMRTFCDPAQYGKPEIWAYYADYDWVVLCQLFGRMIDLPEGWPMYCRDLKQWSWDIERRESARPGLPPFRIKHPPDPEGEHNALVDARWNKLLYEELARAEVTLGLI